MRSVLMALAAAVLLYLATPPFAGWPLALIALVPLLAVSTDAAPGRAALLGWVMGTAYYLISCTWWHTVLVRAFDWPPLPTLLLYGLLNAWHGTVFGIGAGTVSLLRRRFSLSPVLTAPLAFAAAEALIPYIFKGYIGTTVWQVWPLIQFAELGGPPAVSAVVVLANGVIAGVLMAVGRRRWPDRPVRVGALILAAAVAVGYLRGAQVAALRREATGVRVGVVQVNSSAHTIPAPTNGAAALLRVLGRETVIHLASGADLVIWPESVWPVLLPRPDLGSPGPEFLRNLLTGFDGQLLFGAITADADGNRYNSILLLSSQGRVAGIADKNRLVPFFESASLADRFPDGPERLQQLLKRDRPFLRAGQEPVLLDADPLRLGVLICSEEMLMGYGQAVARRGPNLLVGMVSDYWVRETHATSQHTALAAFRAVEARRDLIHVTDSGISALVDGSGRVRLLAPPAAADGPEPSVTALMGEVAPLELFSPGPYAAHLFPWACLAVLVLAAYRRRPLARPPLPVAHPALGPAADSSSEVKADVPSLPRPAGGGRRPGAAPEPDRPAAAGGGGHPG